MVVEGITIDFDKDEGHVRLDCADRSFARLRDLILAETSTADQLAPFYDGIRSILVCRPAAAEGETSDRGGFGRGFRVAFIAASLALSLVIQVIGVVALAKWLLGLGD